ncbi:hypothetical protein [uncultured Roseobacter sp.]|uniref:hypothetical protein n=1 Tax=uncultured Roseobacter sp. TaxID=114847 RepID=UPI002628B372|nr:hypothetical protein [uncultured Roseobacter sp.]
MDEVSQALTWGTLLLCLIAIGIVLLLARSRKSPSIGVRNLSLSRAIDDDASIFLHKGSLNNELSDLDQELATFVDDGIFEVKLERLDDGIETLIEVELDRSGRPSGNVIPFRRRQK